MNKKQNGKKSKIMFLGLVMVVGVLIYLMYSYTGMDKETGVPKALLMRIRPIPWEEIYWDETNQLLKLSVQDITSDGKESRCLRTYHLTSNGLLMGGREFRTQDAISYVNARLKYEVNNNIITIIDKKYSKVLFNLELNELLEESDSINEIKASAVFYELGEDVYIKVILGYRTDQYDELKYSDKFPKLKGIISYTKESSDHSDGYEIKELYCYDVKN